MPCEGDSDHNHRKTIFKDSEVTLAKSGNTALFFSTASLYNGLLVLKTKEKHTFLKNFCILFQERKKTAFDLRNFALEMKEQREQKPNLFGLCRVVTE